MDANFWAIIGVGVVLLGAILTGQRSLRNEISALRKRLDDVHEQLHDGLASVRKEMNGGLASVRKEMNDGLAAIRKEMNDGLAAVRKEMHDVREKLVEVRERLAAVEAILGLRQTTANPEDKDQPRKPRQPTGQDQPAPRAQP